jgi:hypothetical protein
VIREESQVWLKGGGQQFCVGEGRRRRREEEEEKEEEEEERGNG